MAQALKRNETCRGIEYEPFNLMQALHKPPLRILCRKQIKEIVLKYDIVDKFLENFKRYDFALLLLPPVAARKLWDEVGAAEIAVLQGFLAPD